jgi:hypothetical protein
MRLGMQLAVIDDCERKKEGRSNSRGSLHVGKPGEELYAG